MTMPGAADVGFNVGAADVGFNVGAFDVTGLFDPTPLSASIDITLSVGSLSVLAADRKHRPSVPPQA